MIGPRFRAAFAAAFAIAAFALAGAAFAGDPTRQHDRPAAPISSARPDAGRLGILGPDEREANGYVTRTLIDLARRVTARLAGLATPSSAAPGEQASAERTAPATPAPRSRPIVTSAAHFRATGGALGGFALAEPAVPEPGRVGVAFGPGHVEIVTATLRWEIPLSGDPAAIAPDRLRAIAEALPAALEQFDGHPRRLDLTRGVLEARTRAGATAEISLPARSDLD
jgi:hypothetical protein